MTALGRDTLRPDRRHITATGPADARGVDDIIYVCGHLEATQPFHTSPAMQWSIKRDEWAKLAGVTANSRRSGDVQAVQR